ncbi:hypothetical protein KTS45_18655 [Halomicroarcula limicola]|uniref:Uncharacterized protein n=1 Tax=Haloarcula limicola TaxID=1429915 RepID=A0A8J8C5E4_9EURY|nr:hypothetical protein [Halomicroarcula limicola]MBV0926232.1 hypothetical protein [Halomicroarcula limicola]
MPRFNEDKYREEVLAEFLESEFYPNVATYSERVSSAEKQKAGHDAKVEFDWLSDPVIVDEKAQNSDKWINDPSHTFVMEIFGESWVDAGEPDGNIGWFVNPENETEYYVLVWLPDVSLFKITQGIDDYPYLRYQPASAVDFEPEMISEAVQSDLHHLMDDSIGEYRVELTTDVIQAFQSAVEPIPEILAIRDEADYGEWYYEPGHIYEAKIAIVEKERIKETLAEDGLTREILLEKGLRAIKDETVDVDSEKARYIKRSSGKQSGSGDGENPIILVVEYDTYHDIADKTLHYANGSWSEDVRLF